MLKVITLAIVSALAFTGCAQTMTTDTAANYSEPVLTPISAGASDNVGRFIVAAMEAETVRLEASAAPTRD